LNPDLLPLYSSLHHPTARGYDNPRGPIITRDKTTASKSGHGWEISTKLDLQATGQQNVSWIHLVRDTEQWHAVVDMVMNPGFHIIGIS